MAENLFLRLTEDQLEWILLDDASGIVRIRGKGTFGEFEEMTSELSWPDSVCLMIGGEEVLLSSARVPGKQRRQLLQAVPYMVEEQLATDVEKCHFAIGDRSADGEVSVAIVDRQWLRSCLKRLNEAGLYPRQVVIDTLLVPMASAVTVMMDGQRVLVRTGAFSGFCIEKSMFSTAVSLLDEQQRSDLTVLVHSDDQEELQLQLSELHAEMDLSPQVQVLDYPPFESLCRNFGQIPDRNMLNLLQGEFEVEEETRSGSNAWRFAAILAACAFVLHLSLMTAQAVYLDIQGRQMEAEARALYKDIFPDDRNVRDMRRRWRARLAGEVSGESGDFMSLFKDAARHLPDSNLLLNNVNYNESRGDMVLQLEAARSEDLVRFSQTLSKLGLDADIGTISQEQGGVNGSIRVRPGGSQT
ncbi:MAG: type II secretion system protein GspL [Pseudomonadales bacterium]